MVFVYSMLSTLALLAQPVVNPNASPTKIENGYFLTVEDGLPSNKVSAFAETNDGFIWIGTNKGLARYDGSQFKTFGYKPEDSTSIYDDRIAVLQADSHQLLIGTFLGFSIMDLKTEKFRNFQFDDFQLKDTLNKKLPTRITSIERARNGEIWLGTYSSGVFRYLPERDSFICYHYPHERVRPSFPVPKNIDHVLAVKQDRANDDIFWVGTTAGLLQINANSNEVQWFLNPKKAEEDFINQNSFRSIYQHENGSLYLTTWFSKVLIFDPQQEQYKTLPIANKLEEDQVAADRFLSNPIAPIIAKNEEELWIQSLVGLMTYHVPSKSWTRIQLDTREKKEHYGVRFVDSQHRIWTYTRDGVLVFDPVQQQFIEYDYSHLNVGNAGFTYYFLDQKPATNFTVLSRSAEGIYHFDTQNSTWGKFSIPEQYLDLNKRFVPLGYAKSPSDTWTIISRNDIFDFNPSIGTFKKIRIPAEFNKMLFRALLWDENGSLWLGTLGSGLLKWDPKTDQWTIFKKELEPELPLDDVGLINRLFEDSYGNIWINRFGGYSVFDTQRDTFYNFLDRYEPLVQLPSIEEIQEDKQGRVWINGISGVIAYGLASQPAKGLQKQYDLMEDYQLSTIAFMDIDEHGDLWMLGTGRLVKMDLETMQLTFHSLKYGINEESIYGFKMLGDNQILIGGGNKIWLAKTDDLVLNSEQPIPYLTGVQVLQRPYLSGQPAHLIKELKLQYAENFFSLEFSSIGFTRGTENQFRYRLKNFEDQWTTANQRRFANFTNVPPGTYTFELQVANNESIWNEEILSIPISIATPWWQRTWFWVLVLGGITGIGYSLYRFRINQVRKEERMRLAYEKKLTKVEMAALRAQMNPHFIFNALNSIEYFIISNEQETAVDYLNRFSRLVRLILQNSQNTLVPLKDDLEALRLYIEIENMRFDNLFDYDLRFSENINPATVLITPLLLQPYVEHAIWHGLMQKKEGRGKISVSIRKESNSLICILEDNGIGRTAAKKIKSKSATKGKSYGMKITKDRLEALNQLGDAKASIQIFDLKDNFGKAKGTRIEIFIPMSGKLNTTV